MSSVPKGMSEKSDTLDAFPAAAPPSPIASPSPPKHQSVSTLSRSSRLNKHNIWIFYIKWAATVLAATASVVFGIWAPLSYYMTESTSRDNNAMQMSMLSSVSAANGVAQAALSTASLQNEMLLDTHSQLVAMGKLALADYCHRYTVRGILLMNLITTSMVGSILILFLFSSEKRLWLFESFFVSTGKDCH